MSPSREDACSCSAELLRQMATWDLPGSSQVSAGRAPLPAAASPAPAWGPGELAGLINSSCQGSSKPCSESWGAHPLEHKTHSGNRIPETPLVPVPETRAFSCAKRGIAGPTRKLVAARVGGCLASWRGGGGGGAGVWPPLPGVLEGGPDNPTFLVVWPPLGGGGRGCEKGKHTGCVPSLQDLKQTPTGKRWAPFSGRERSDMQLVLVMSQRSCFLAPAFHQRQAAALSPVSPYLVFAKPSEGSCCSPNSTDDDTEGQGQAHGQDSNPGLADSKVVPAALRALPLRLPIQGPNTTPGHGRCQ